MNPILVTTLLVFAMPIAGFGWAEGSNLLLDPYMICKKSRQNRGGKHHDICRNGTSLLKEITKGINMGFKECEYQFKNRRWNCTQHKRSMKKILIKDTRETGFVNAITAAGVTYAVTRACTMGNLVECSCDKNHRRNIGSISSSISDGSSSSGSNIGVGGDGIDKNEIISAAASAATNNATNDRKKKKKSNMNTAVNMRSNRKLGKNLILPDGDWEWGGCGDNVNFGFRKSREFLDTRYKRRSDIKTLVKIHNNDAGRLAVRNYMRLECKCHGLSGSCTIRTCWMKMSPFRDVGNRLKDRFDGAAKVITHNDGHSFIPEERTIKPPTRQDLIYTEDSPDYCLPNPKTGSLGTQGRECNVTSDGIDGCALLCCTRGHDHRIIKEKVNCKCVFKWCCEVTCSTCIEKREVNTCR